MGAMAGGHYTSPGVTSNFLCMHPNPQAPATSRGTNGNLAETEYEVGSNVQGDAACAVCQRGGITQTYVQWGRSTSCSTLSSSGRALSVSRCRRW